MVRAEETTFVVGDPVRDLVFRQKHKSVEAARAVALKHPGACVFQVKFTFEVTDVGVTEAARPLTCKICDQKVLKRDRLAHMRRVHGTPKSRWPRKTIDDTFEP